MNRRPENQHVNNFDFTKNFEPKDTLGQFVKKGMMALHFKTNYRTVGKYLIILSIAIIIMSFFNLIGSIHHNNKLVYIATMQKETKINEVEQSQNIKAIKNLTQEDIDKTIAFVKTVHANQLQRTLDFYWKFKFISENNPARYPSAKTVRRITGFRNDINEHYNSRVISLTNTYKAIIRGDKVFNKEDIVNIIEWNSAMNNNINKSYKELDDYLASWNEDFTDQKIIQKYLEDNKELIAKSNPFM